MIRSASLIACGVVAVALALLAWSQAWSDSSPHAEPSAVVEDGDTAGQPNDAQAETTDSAIRSMRRLVEDTRSEDSETSAGSVEAPVGERRRGHTVTGRLVDPNGRGIGGAIVFYASDQSDYHQFRAHDDLDLSHPHTTTATNGSFSISEVDHGLVLSMWIEHPFYVGFQIERTINAPADFGDIPMAPGSTLRGRVVDPIGQPIEGAEIRLGRESRKQDRTNAMGQFVLHGTKRQPTIRIEAPGFVPIHIRRPESISRERTWVVNMTRTAEITAIVQDLLGGVRGIEVRSLDTRKSFVELDQVSESGPTSRWIGTDLPPGKYRLRAWSYPFGQSEWQTISAASGANNTLNFRTKPYPKHRFRCVHAQTGEPIEGATVTCQNPRTTGDTRPPQIGKTDSNGWVDFAINTDVFSRLKVVREGYEDRQWNPGKNIPEPRAIISLNPIQIVDKGQLSVSIAGEAGRFSPIAQSSDGAYQELIQNADDPSTFEGTLGAGEYRIRFRTHKRALGPRSIHRKPIHKVQVHAGKLTRLKLHPPPNGKLRVVVTSAGRPLEGAIVHAIDRNGEDWQDSYDPRVKTDTNGEVQCITLARGRWTLFARRRKDGLPSASHVVRVRHPGQDLGTIYLELGDMTLSGQLDLSWMNAETRTRFLYRRNEAARAWLTPQEISAADPFWSSHHGLPQTFSTVSAPIGDDGTFQFDHVPPGHWLLRLTSSRTMLHQEVIHAGRTDQHVGVIWHNNQRPDAVVRCLTHDSFPYASQPARLMDVITQPDGKTQLAWRQSMETNRQGVLKIAHTPPGHYMLDFSYQGTSSRAGKSATDPDTYQFPIYIDEHGVVNPPAVVVY